MPDINKELLNHLADLARLDISSDREKMLDDFQGIVEYFEKLDELDVENVEPMSGGSELENVWREDESGDKRIISKEALREFPQEEDGYNKIPPVF